MVLDYYNYKSEPSQPGFNLFYHKHNVAMLSGYVVISGDYDGDIKVFIKEGKVINYFFITRDGWDIGL